MSIYFLNIQFFVFELFSIPCFSNCFYNHTLHIYVHFVFMYITYCIMCFLFHIFVFHIFWSRYLSRYYIILCRLYQKHGIYWRIMGFQAIQEEVMELTFLFGLNTVIGWGLIFYV